MKRLLSFSVTSTFTFILSILAILIIAVSAPGMVQAVLGPAASPGDVQPGNAIQASPYYGSVVNPAVNFGSLTDNGTAAYMGIGISTPVSPLQIYSTTSTQPETIDLDGPSPITAQWNDYSNTGGAFAGSGFLARFARNTRASPGNAQPGDRLGFNVFGGWAGTGFKHTGAIEAMVDSGTVSDTSLPTYMRFSTTPNGSASRLERMRITAAGTVGIGTANPANGKLDVETSSGAAVYGHSDSSYGVYGSSTAGGGVIGTSDSNAGVEGDSNTGDAVMGFSTSGSGVWGVSAVGDGVLGNSTTGDGVGGASNSGLGISGFSYYWRGVYGSNNSGNYGYLGDNVSGVYGNGVSGFAGLFDGKVKVNGTENVTNNLYVGGTMLVNTAAADQVAALTAYAPSGHNGLYGKSDSWNGVLGISTSGTGVAGGSTSHFGVLGTSTSAGSYGVRGESTGGTGVYGQGGTYAGYFNGYTYISGNCTVTGQMFKGGGAFKIDHPLDPENKYLLHSFVESPEMRNIYEGHVLLNEKGEAVVEMPAYFEALNRDFEYQLTCVGGYAPAYVAEEINGNHFRIAGGRPGLKISWQVTGVRQDAYAKAHPIVVEQVKPAGEKGLYLHPLEWGQPESKGISAALNK